MLLSEFAGGLYLGLRSSLDVEFVLEIDGEHFVGSQSLVPAGCRCAARTGGPPTACCQAQ